MFGSCTELEFYEPDRSTTDLQKTGLQFQMSFTTGQLM